MDSGKSFGFCIPVLVGKIDEYLIKSFSTLT